MLDIFIITNILFLQNKKNHIVLLLKITLLEEFELHGGKLSIFFLNQEKHTTVQFLR